MFFFDINIIIKFKLELNDNISGTINLTNSLCYQNLLFTVGVNQASGGMIRVANPPCINILISV